MDLKKINFEQNKINLKNNDEIFKNKENNYKIMYGSEFTDSQFSKTSVLFSNIILNKFLNDVIKNAEKNDERDDNIHYYQLQNKLYVIKFLSPSNNYIYQYFCSYLSRNVFGNIEKSFGLDEYSLGLSNLSYLDLTNEKTEFNGLNEFNEFNESGELKKISFNTNKYEFLLVINVGGDNIIRLNQEQINLDLYSGICFSNKIPFDIVNKSGKFLIVLINYFNGYKRYEYNKHPNQKKIQTK